MKILGLLGGTSWHSTIEYYRHINTAINTHFGDNTNPPLLLYTMNQSLIHRYQIENKWQEIAEAFIEGGIRLQNAGAQKLMFCANTPHKVHKEVAQALDIGLLHIADATAEAIKKKEVEKVLFLGTKYTMEEDFIRQIISSYGIQVFAPTEKNMIDELHRIIQKELTYGNILSESKKYILGVIQSYIDQGIGGVILGCTEFPLIIKEGDLNLPIFNTTNIHAQAGVEYILS